MRTKASVLRNRILFVVFLLVAVVFLFPFVFLLMASFKPAGMIINVSEVFRLKPGSFTLENYATLLSYRDGIFFTWYRNSLVLLVLQIAPGLLLSSMAGYALAFYSFKGKGLLISLTMVLLTIPFEILMIPLFKEAVMLHVNNTFMGVVFTGLVTPFMVFFFRQSALGLPRELADAGRIDGCHEFGIFFRIMMPLMLPAYGAMAIMQGLGSWNNLLWPLIVLSSNEHMTLTVGISSLVSANSAENYDLLLSASTCAILPILVLFLLFQNTFISGLTVGGVKE